MSPSRPTILALAIAFPFISITAAQSPEPVFESGQSRPLALSPDGTKLFAVNTPDHRLEIFDVSGPGLLTLAASVPVGLEPIAVAARSNTEVWVVNQLSDSVSIVDVGSVPPRVRRTLLVGDEPGDVVFAGPGGRRAFITSARRGQNGRVPAQLFTPGLGRANIWVFDADNVGGGPGGDPLTVLTLFGDTPRALAVSPDGATVYAAVFRSGSRTTVVPSGVIPDGSGLAPTANVEGVPAPRTSLIVKHDGAHWRDPSGRSWDDAIRFSLPDKDVFAIDATANPPREIASWSGVGTVLFGMAVNPVTGTLYVSNTEARNDVRFEGSGALGGSTVRGHVVENRITAVDAAGVRPRHLNGHINYASGSGSFAERIRSLAQPMGMAVTADGSTIYLAAFGTGRIAIIPTATLEAGTYLPRLPATILVPGGGPTGLVLDQARSRLYVLSRFDNAVSVINVSNRATLARVALHDAETPDVVAGRRVFYDAARSSGHGDASCASCHIFGDSDDLAWDLGNPDGSVASNPNPFRFPKAFTAPPFHPMKGPMATLTLRSMPGHGPLHWRGDRTGGSDPSGDPMDTRAGLLQFAGAFDSVLGRGAALDPVSMNTMADFVLRLTAPPNPIRALDNSLTEPQDRGRLLFHDLTVTAAGACAACHTLDPSKSEFGADGMSSFDGFPQLFKIASLRGLYSKVGMFGMSEDPLFAPGENGFAGDQVRGFGYSFDGSVDTIVRFLRARVFVSLTEPRRSDLAEFMMAFDTDLAPVVGQQVTRSALTAPTADARIDLLLARAAVTSPRPECDVVVHGVAGGQARGWVRLASGLFRSDRAAETSITDAALRALALAPGQELTYTAVAPGTGVRLGIDRDGDGFLDGDEADARSNPADPASTPLDRDGDGRVNDGDCAPDNPGAIQSPAEVVGIGIVRDKGTSSTSVSWASQGSTAGTATLYDVCSGDPAELRADRGFARATCVATSAPDAPWIDPRIDPKPSRGFWYLARARNACGVGSYGSSGRGDPRVIALCP